MYWLILVVIVVAALSIFINKAVTALPVTELRRRARDEREGGLYRLAVRHRQLLWSAGLLNFVLVSIAFAQLQEWWKIFILLAIIVAMDYFLPAPKPGHTSWSFASKLAGWVEKLIGWLPPDKSAQNHQAAPSAVFDKSDLQEFLSSQSRRTGNRISPDELATAVRALDFSTKTVSDAMNPIAKAKLVKETDDIGPHLLDELHKAGGECFLVVAESKSKTEAPRPVGALYLDNALDRTEGGSVKDAMQSGMEFMQEDLSLAEALQQFLNARRHFFAVQNQFEELVGTLSLRDLLAQIFGSPETPEAEGVKMGANDKNASKPAKK